MQNEIEVNATDLIPDAQAGIAQSRQTVKLANPIMINGEQCAELNVDFSLVTRKTMAEALKSFRRTMGGSYVMQTMQTEPMLCFELFCAAAAKTMGCDITDIERITGKDILTAEYQGKLFLMKIFADYSSLTWH